ncbi:hypothetical protein ACP4OV_012053 [Aristida adscensionis]
MSCLGRAAVPVRRVWRGLRARLGLRRAAGKFASYTAISRGAGPEDRSPDGAADGAGGLGRLRREVRSCEYHDVHVMWEMLGNPGAAGGAMGAATPDVAAGEASGRAAAATTRGRRRRSRGKPVAWRRLAAYCCAL